jgi:CRP-like cAMP-binding protein
MNERTPDQDAAPVTADVLRELSAFDGMSDAHLERIAALARREHVTSGTEILKEGDLADDLRVVLTGRLSLTLRVPGGGNLSVVTLTRGEILGWSALFDGRTWQASARALKDSSLVVLPGTELRALCERDHDAGYHVMRMMFSCVAARLQDTRLQLLDMFA